MFSASLKMGMMTDSIPPDYTRQFGPARRPQLGRDLLVVKPNDGPSVPSP
jgi:hypothetical protein